MRCGAAKPRAARLAGERTQLRVMMSGLLRLHLWVIVDVLNGGRFSGV